MNKLFTKEELATWIASLKDAAENDECFDVDWFKPTKNSSIAIVGGWESGFDATDSDLFCMSKSNPGYVMSIKICENKGPYAYCDFETLNMPLDANGEVENNCIPLEWDDNPEAVAEFFMIEFDRLLK
jgi:hypothetical protein